MADAAKEVSGGGDDIADVVQTADDGVELVV